MSNEIILVETFDDFERSFDGVGAVEYDWEPQSQRPEDFVDFTTEDGKKRLVDYLGFLDEERRKHASILAKLEGYDPEVLYNKMNNMQLSIQEHACGVQRVYEEFAAMNIRLGRLAEIFGYNFTDDNKLTKQGEHQEPLLRLGDKWGESK